MPVQKHVFSTTTVIRGGAIGRVAGLCLATSSGAREYRNKLKPQVHCPHKARQICSAFQPTYTANEVQSVAVVGGGITGLATAYFISNQLPRCRVTVFERGESLGGWMRSNMVDVGDGSVLFEAGPRSLRPNPPNGVLTLRLAQRLGLLDDMIVVSKDAPAARNRFVYYPDRLVRMPAQGDGIFNILRTVLAEPVFKGVFGAMFMEHFRPGRDRQIQDESIGQFLTRRLNKNLVNNLVSAILHGIYAGDVWKLSARSILGRPWFQERKHGDFSEGIAQSIIDKSAWVYFDDIRLQEKLSEDPWPEEVRTQLQKCSVFTFKNGIQQLVDGLADHLVENDNVSIKTSSSIQSIAKVTDGDLDQPSMRISYTEATGTTAQESFSHVVSATGPHALAGLLSDGAVTLPRGIRAVTVGVVNFYFPPTSRLFFSQQGSDTDASNLKGFGYLIPNSIPFEQNPERALGVIFDSDIAPAHFTTVPESSRGTRLTVMLGGHWWDGWTSYPDTDELVEMAQAVLSRHLGVTTPPTATRATLQRDCIPQYTVGHTGRLTDLHGQLANAYAGRIRVAGNWYTGVGVNDCVRAAWDLVQGLKADEDAGGGGLSVTEHKTGLESFKTGRTMALARLRQKGVYEVLETTEYHA